jgi:glycyl-tRNA synthetase beta chain
MRWGDRNAEFVRPVHWLVLMHGATVIDAEIMEVRSGNTTRGHRFHANDAIALKTSADYVLLLKQRGFVIADCAERKQLILNSVLSTAQQLGGTALINEELLDEVTALNEWPVPVAGEFDAAFLSVPAEALIKTMQDNQKYFPVLDARGALKNCFITISNIDSRAPQKVKAGNERVVRPRLADAKFFWEQDQKKPLEEFGRALEHVVFQAKLGSLGEKTRRVMVLCTHIAKRLGVNVALAERAALLSKCDLMTAMVGEFADLQGVMGKRYAEVAGEAPAVALALDEQYRPRGAGDDTASESIGQILAIADKLDTLVGIFAIGEKPTGEKDPYALRRCALGIVRTIIERQLDLDLHDLIALAVTQLQGRVDAAAVADDVFDYITERLRAYYADSGVTPDVFDAVHALKPARPLDFDKRIHAVTAFRHLEEAQSLAAANKRVGNILKKSADATQAKVQENLLQEVAEKELYANLCALHDKVDKLFNQGDYATALRELSVLRAPIDAFFDSVMVMVDDAALRQNRIALLSRMSALFMRAADLSRLQ